jgi:hypothetical protein
VGVSYLYPIEALHILFSIYTVYSRSGITRRYYIPTTAHTLAPSKLYLSSIEALTHHTFPI